jgi:predicted transcriptional regulator
MLKKKSAQLTPLELEIMNVLWETRLANVQTVQQGLKRDIAYTTVQTMLNILLRKGKVERTLKNRAYFYKPLVSRRQVVNQTIGDIVDRLFGGSAENFLMGMVETKYLTPEKIAQLNKLCEQTRTGAGADEEKKEEKK